MLKTGNILEGKYKISGLIGQGGLGSVYKAFQLDLQREVAIKVLHGKIAEDEDWKLRTLREGKALAKLSHPNIVAIYFLGFSRDDQIYMAMELVQGESTRQLLKEAGKLPVLRALRITRDAALALEYAHENGIVHRDLKPENIMVQNEPRADFVKIIDFGLACMSDPNNQRLTLTGELLGTPKYMSPEQANGLKMDARTDIYSLCACLFEFITGTPCFDADTPLALMYKHANKPVPAITPAMVDNFSPALNKLITGAMEKDPDRRFQSMKIFAEQIEKVIDEIESVLTTNVSTVLTQERDKNKSTGRIIGKKIARDRLFLMAALLIVISAGFCFVAYKTKQTNSKSILLQDSPKPSTLLKRDARRTERHLRLIEHTYGKISVECAKANHELGMDCSRKKEYPQSEKYLEEAILIWTKLTGPNSRQVAEEKDYLADTLRYEKKYQAAESLIREAMKSREKIFGADCAESAWSMQILAEICIANGRFEEAENLLKKCIEIRQGKDPERDYLVAGHEISLGQLYLKEEKFELAQGCFERALAIKEHNQTRSAENAKIMQDLAKCYRHEGNDVRAREIENESSKIMKSLGQTP